MFNILIDLTPEITVQHAQLSDENLGNKITELMQEKKINIAA